MASNKKKNVLREAFLGVRHILIFAVLMSLVYGLLKLSGPIFMILVFDRVLPARSEATLIVLLGLLVVVIAVMMLLDYSRRRILARFGAQFQERIEDHIFSSTARDAYLSKGGSKPAAGLNEVDQLRGFFHSGSLVVILDFMWSPVFMAVLFVIDPLVGWVVTAGVALLGVIHTLRMSYEKAREERRNEAGDRINSLKDTLLVSRHVIESQQMVAAYNRQWTQARRSSRDTAVEIRDGTAWFATLSSHATLVIQYTALSAAAYLTIKGQLTVGAMVASMYLARHVFNPAERFLKQIPSVRETMDNWKKLDKILSTARTPTAPTPGAATLRLQQVSARCPVTRNLLLRNLSFEAAPGSSIEIVGGGGSGKSVLAEVLIGRFPRAGGKVLLDTVDIERLSIADAAETIGYVPQRVDFIAGTIAENIGGLILEPGEARLIRVAKLAQMHDRILSLPEGYATRIDPTGSIFSKSERHRLALARALYPSPRILIIDEPDTSFRDALPKSLKKTFADFHSAGGILIMLTRLALKKHDATLRFALEDGILKKINPDPIPDLRIVELSEVRSSQNNGSMLV